MLNSNSRIRTQRAKWFLLFPVALLLLTTACNTQKETTTATDRNRGGRPSIDELFEQDTDGDGKLSKAELQGPNAENFASIDTDGEAADHHVVRAGLFYLISL